ncbi:MAG: NADH-quinone oxidoreductase subunit H [Xanthomonadaceae bacterium]|nr:NADH-quinone oxidoreductase subunit H [Rhodospirillaceae bacterium]NIA17743.1 NADH-quinone oxidoreductase subunit H [Xanthomonadaceae bacterium]
MFDVVLKFIMMLIVIFGSVFLGLFFKGIDRILSAKMQRRIGPPLWQPFYDVRKLMIKESVIPKGSIKWIFELFALVSLTASILILFYIPILGKSILGNSGDLVLIIYLFIFPGLSLVLGAFSSNSSYSNLGGQRLIINMLGYEFPLAIICLTPVWLVYKKGFSNIFSLNTIYEHNVWGLTSPLGIIGLLLESIVVFFVIAGELSKTPFDIDTADSEIAGGVLAEYSGRNLAMFYMAEAVKMIALASLFIALFFPWNIQGNFGIMFLVYLLKIFFIIFISSTLIKTVTSRFKISRLTRFYWGYLSLFAIIGFLFTL